MRQAIIAAVLVLASAMPAFAEWGLYVNRDNKAWVLERTFAFEWETDRNCKSAARALWATGTVKGVACQEYAATSFSPTARAQERAAAVAAARARSESTIMEQAKGELRELAKQTRDLNRQVEQDEISERAAANHRGGRYSYPKGR